MKILEFNKKFCRKYERKEIVVNTVLSIILVLLFFSIFFLMKDIRRFKIVVSSFDNKEKLYNSPNLMSLNVQTEAITQRKTNCSIWNCLDIYRCGRNDKEHLKIYIYPNAKIGNEKKLSISKEYDRILKIIRRSRFHTNDPNEACLFLPNIDLLNESLLDRNIASHALASLRWWEEGENHVIFNMLPGIAPEYKTALDINVGKAIVLGGGFDTWSYRPGFDVAIPVWSPLIEESTMSNSMMQRMYFFFVAQINLLPETVAVLTLLSSLHPEKVHITDRCKESKITVRCTRQDSTKVAYPEVLNKGVFCFYGRGLRIGQPDLLEIMSQGCIPVIAVDNLVLPFQDVIDWANVSVRINERNISNIIEILNSISNTKIQEMQKQVNHIYSKHFKSLTAVVHTALELLENRICVFKLRNFGTDNYSPGINVFNPIFLPIHASKAQGFTAVILTYDRVGSLLELVQKLSRVTSLQSILVIWNNQRKSPPQMSAFETAGKPLRIIKSKENKLSNRFFPYKEIDTESVLTLDDDIVMLTVDELDFGFEVWREFPSYIVGFPSRLHVWDNNSLSWHYDSQWTNQISMVLTGAAFHHKYWNYMYTYSMPLEIRSWVDEDMNCEDIAMNFLVANMTNNPPIKVTPRKKFKCPECINTEMLSADLDHMRKRSECINKFSKIYGRVPLKTIEFRADPVLFRNKFPDKLKRYNDIGSL